MIMRLMGSPAKAVPRENAAADPVLPDTAEAALKTPVKDQIKDQLRTRLPETAPLPKGMTAFMVTRDGCDLFRSEEPYEDERRA